MAESCCGPAAGRPSPASIFDNRQRSSNYRIKHPVPRASSGHIAVDKLLAHAAKFRSKALIFFACFVVAAAVGIFLLHNDWPFTETKVRADLASATSADVQFGSFHQHYFPPGCVAENVTFRERSGGNPLVSIRTLAIKASLSNLLRHRLSLINAEGLRGELVPGALFKNASGDTPVIEQFVASDSIVEIPRRGEQQRLQFRIHKLSLRNVNNRGGVTSFDAVLDIPFPAGLASVSGQFGPWQTNDAASTPISGKYSLKNAGLSVFHSIAGIVSSAGTFRGDLKQIQVEGSTHSPEFIVAKTEHGLPLDTNFEAIVETHTGNVALPHFTAHFGRDDITGNGSIARRSDGKRSTLLDLTCSRGRIEDTFYPFIQSARSSLTGDVSFRMQIALTSGHKPFLQKLSLNSDFQIQNARFTNSQTETRISKISAPPNQDQTQSPAELQGRVRLENAVARFSQLNVHDDEASAAFHGSYNLENENIDLHGNLKTAASLTKTTNGIKAVFAKVIEAFFKKKPHVTVVPVHIGGTYSHPNFGLDL